MTATPFIDLGDQARGADLFRQLVDTAPDAMIVVDAAGRIVLVNLQTERLFGYRRDEILGQTIELFIPERFKSSHIGHRTGFTHAPKVRPMGSGLELFARRSDGSEFPIEISLSPLSTGAGMLVSASLRDITERKRNELMVRRLAAIVDASKDAIFSWDLDGIVTSWNPGAEAIFGYTGAEIVGQRRDLLHTTGTGGEDSRERLDRLMTGQSIEHIETLQRRKDDRTIDVARTLSPIRDGSGKIVGVSEVARDITERKRLDAIAKRTQEYLLSAVESIQGAFAIFDVHDRLVLCNSTYRDILGKPVRGEIVGRAFAELLDSNLDAGTFELDGRPRGELTALWRAYHASPAGAIDVKTKAGHNLRIVERRTVEGGTVSTIWDVTDDVEREEELRRARAVAEAASSAKSEFLASMSHELRTPLNAILGFAQLLHRDKKTPLSERQKERIAHVLTGGEHLLRLIDDVLDLSRIEAGRVLISPEPVSVPEVLEEVQTTLGPMASRAEIEIKLAPLPPSLPMIVADRTRFRQILMNYGSNAIKYGRKGGSVLFRATLATNALQVAVIDDGIGIPADKQDRIFSPFHRAGQETGPIEGTGIGLAITKRLAELMKGRVGFQSREGLGSEFWIELGLHEENPALPQSANRTDAAESPLSSGDGPRFLVVYVEDNPSNIAFMEDLLGEYERVELLTAPTAEIGVELVRGRQPDVVIMDINLPGMSGFEAAKQLRSWPETRDIPVLALSAAAMVRDAMRATEGGFYRYLTKPVKVDELTAVLEELLLPKS